MEDLYVLQTPGVPATFLQDAHRPFQLLVYHLPPPPPGFLYAFTCGPTNFMQPPAIAPLTDDRNFASLPTPSTAVAYVSDRSLPGSPAPWTAPVSASTSSKVDQLHSAASTSFSQHQLGNSCASNAGEPSACSTPFWCTKEKGFPRSQSCIAEMKNSAQQEQSDSTLSTCAQKTPDEAIQENKRFNKTPSFRVKKFVRTNSRTNCVPEATKMLQDSAAFPTCRLPLPLPDHKPVQHRIRDQHWRVRTKPKELVQGHENKPDVNCSHAGAEVCNANVGELNKLIGSFSFGLNS